MRSLRSRVKLGPWRPLFVNSTCSNATSPYLAQEGIGLRILTIGYQGSVIRLRGPAKVMRNRSGARWVQTRIELDRLSSGVQGFPMALESAEDRSQVVQGTCQIGDERC